jgi:hypothetical protein
MHRPRVPRPVLTAVALCIALFLLGGATGSYGDSSDEADRAIPNPCAGPDAAKLRCPDLQMRRPYDFQTERTPQGRILLRATSAIKSRGDGPIELHGRRSGRREMRVRQRIYRVDGSHLTVRTGGELYFYFIPGQGRYWKFANAARFELWSLNRKGHRKRLVRTGPKLHYCFRDLVKTSGGPHSPKRRLYPGCNRDPGKRRVTLGTSVGWSDVYPAGYHEQWIDVTGLRGCFAYVHVADPKNLIFESHEDNNSSQRIVRLPPSRGPGPCP